MQKKKSFIKQLWERYDSESPEFFKRFYRFGRVLVAFAVSIVAPDVVFPDVHVPEWLLIVAGYIGVAGVSIMTVSKAARKDNDNENPKNDAEIPQNGE